MIRPVPAPSPRTVAQAVRPVDDRYAGAFGSVLRAVRGGPDGDATATPAASVAAPAADREPKPSVEAVTAPATPPAAAQVTTPVEVAAASTGRADGDADAAFDVGTDDRAVPPTADGQGVAAIPGALPPSGALTTVPLPVVSAAPSSATETQGATEAATLSSSALDAGSPVKRDLRRLPKTIAKVPADGDVAVSPAKPVPATAEISPLASAAPHEVTLIRTDGSPTIPLVASPDVPIALALPQPASPSGTTHSTAAMSLADALLGSSHGSADGGRDWARAFDTGGAAHVEARTQSLGNIDIAVARAANGVAITLGARTEETRALLADAHPRLVADARAAGLVLSQSRADDAPAGERRGGGRQSRPRVAAIATGTVMTGAPPADRFA